MVSNYASGGKHAKHRYILAVNLPDTFRCPKRQIATKKNKIICLSFMCCLKQKNSITKYNLRTVFLRFAPDKERLSIHAFNKSGRHLEFSINDDIRGMIIQVAKMTTILQCVHIKRNVFTLYQEEYFLYTMSLWVCYRNFKAVVQKILMDR